MTIIEIFTDIVTSV